MVQETRSEKRSATEKGKSQDRRTFLKQCLRGSPLLLGILPLEAKGAEEEDGYRPKEGISGG